VIVVIFDVPSWQMFFYSCDTNLMIVAVVFVFVVRFMLLIGFV